MSSSVRKTSNHRILNTNYANERQFRSIDQNGNSLSKGAQSSRSSDTERTESEPHEIQSCRTLKRRPDMELFASLCSLRCLLFKFRGLISVSVIGVHWRNSVQNPMVRRLFRFGSTIELRAAFGSPWCSHF